MILYFLEQGIHHFNLQVKYEDNHLFANK